MTARELKRRLYARHFAAARQMPGPWTVIEEYRCIDVLAFSAWSSARRYARVGYEVKVSRADLRRELLRPDKRQANVEWCNEFYFAVPAGLLRPEELAFDEPIWQPEDWVGERCPRGCAPNGRRKTTRLRVPIPRTTRSQWDGWWDYVNCPTCNGKGTVAPSRVERETPALWCPRDVGLILVDERGTRVHRKSPRRREVPALTPEELGPLVRWVSMRPDPRHHPEPARQLELAS
jgi:hypothetical protein